MKDHYICFSIICLIIIMMLSACNIKNDVVLKVSNNDIYIKTKYGDKLHFDVSSSANLHHQFINYTISLLNTDKNSDNAIYIVLRDQPESVYNDPLLVFSEIDSKDKISLYKMENNYVFIYNNYIKTYPIDNELFKGCSETNAIERFKEIINVRQ